MGEIPDWSPQEYDFIDKKDAYNWNAAFVFLTMALCRQALVHASLVAFRDLPVFESGLLGVSGLSNDMRVLLESDRPEAFRA